MPIVGSSGAPCEAGRAATNRRDPREWPSAGEHSEQRRGCGREAGAFSHIVDRAVAGGGTLKLWLRAKSSSRLPPVSEGGGETVNPGLRSPSALGEIIGRGARPWHLATAADFSRGRRPVFRRPGFPCKAARPNLRTLRERLQVRPPLRRFRVPATRKVESADVGRPGGWRAVGKAARS